MYVCKKLIIMTQVNESILSELKENTKALNRLAYEFSKHRTTIDRWVDTNNIALTTPMAVKAIAEELNVNSDTILTKD